MKVAWLPGRNAEASRANALLLGGTAVRNEKGKGWEAGTVTRAVAR